MGHITQSIAEVLSDRPLALARPADPVSQVAQRMRAAESACALVMDGDRLIGIFTERDFLNRVAARLLDPRTLPVAEVMTPDPVALRGSDCVSYAINRMALGGYRQVPVLDDTGRPVGVLAPRDVTAHLREVFGPADEDPRPGFEAWVDLGGG